MLWETNKTMAMRRDLIMEIPISQGVVRMRNVSMKIPIHHLVVESTI